MRKLVIIGASAVGREVLWIVQRMNAVSPAWEIIGFLDDNETIQGAQIKGIPVLGTSDSVGNYQDVYFLCAINAPKIRECIVEKTKRLCPNAKFATLVDPGAVVADNASIGEGSIVYMNTVVSVEAKLGTHNIVNYGCTVGHDVVTEDFVSINPGSNLSGHVHIGRVTEVGTGTKVIQGLWIGEGSVLGAGTVVVRDIPENSTAVGVPARVIKHENN